MAGTGVTLVGEAQFRASLRRAAGDLQDLTVVNREVGEDVVAAAGPFIPTASGYLESTGRVVAYPAGADLVWTAKYAGPQYYGVPGHNIEPHPWAVEAAQHTEPQWTATYAAGVQHILNKVKGI